MSEEEGHRGEEEEEDVLDLEYIENKRQRASADDFEFEDVDSDEVPRHTFAVPAPVSRPRTMSDNHLVPFEMIPESNVDAVRPEQAVVDSVSLYNHLGMMTLLYGHVTQGISAPVIYDTKNQRM